MKSMRVLDMLDIDSPEHSVMVSIKSDGNILWVHVDGITVLRIQGIPELHIDDAREVE